MFPVQSTSVETQPIRRVANILGRSKVGKLISYGAVYNCRTVAGSSSYSQHAWGNAIDVFPTPGGDVQAKLRAIADNAVAQATKATIANRGRKAHVAQVIDHDARRIWEPGKGWFPYTGTTGAHVHISGAPMFYGKPPCA